MIRFEDPWLLSFLLIVPVVVYFHFKKFTVARMRFSSLHILKRLHSNKAAFALNILFFFRLVVIVLFVMALARPQSGRKDTEITTEGVDIILVLDTSGSMQALDFQIEGKRKNRLEVVKDVVEKFIKGRTNDRIGMVVFGEHAFTQCPLTLDYGVLIGFLKEIEIGMAGDATAIGSAIGTAVRRLKDISSKSKVMILLTDGRNNAGDILPKNAAEIARTFGIKIYTIGAGTKGKAPFLVDTFFGQRYVYQEVDLDETTLGDVAETTGGKYFRATNTEALKEIYAQIDRMEKTEVKVKEYMEYNELFAYLLLPALIVLLGQVVLSQTRYRKLP